MKIPELRQLKTMQQKAVLSDNGFVWEKASEGMRENFDKAY